MFKAIDRTLASNEALKLAILLRVQPIIPWNILNYILSVSSCTPSNFFIGTFIGIGPGTLVFLYVGVNIQNVSEIVGGKRPVSLVEIAFLTLSSIALLLLVWTISKESKKHLIQILSQEEDEKSAGGVSDHFELQEDKDGGIIYID